LIAAAAAAAAGGNGWTCVVVCFLFRLVLANFVHRESSGEGWKRGGCCCAACEQISEVMVSLVAL